MKLRRLPANGKSLNASSCGHKIEPHHSNTQREVTASDFHPDGAEGVRPFQFLNSDSKRCFSFSQCGAIAVVAVTSVPMVCKLNLKSE
jgi:hypothetical protein